MIISGIILYVIIGCIYAYVDYNKNKKIHDKKYECNPDAVYEELLLLIFKVFTWPFLILIDIKI